MNEQGLLGDRYELGELLGRGGMAEVRKGRDRRLGRTVAIKMLRTDLATDPTFQVRFRREAQSAAMLNHPSIVAVYDTGEDQLNGARVPYIVMEYVEGKTLRQILQEQQRITTERSLEIISGVLEALDYSHRAGIVHRDIKPGNVMITPTGDVKVMDFGIARALSDVGATVTQTAAVVGTAQYLSPEQARGETADARSDLYSTGCVLFELLTGRPPFLGDSLVSVAVSHVRENPTPPSQLDPSIPPQVDAIVMKALAKDRLERYQSATEMRADVQRALDGRPVQAEATTAYLPAMVPGETATRAYPTGGYGGTAYTESPVTEAAEPVSRAERHQRRRGIGWGALLVAVIAVLLLAGFVGWSLFRNEGTQQVSVPNVVGQQQTAAVETLREANLEASVETAFSESVPAGQVMSQSPDPQTKVDEGSTVTLTVSGGQEEVVVPDNLVGMSTADARNALREAKLQVGSVTAEPSDRPENEVLRTDPAPGSTVPAGTRVNLFYSSGQQELPNLVGKSRDDAVAIVEQAGWRAIVQEVATTEAPPGTVVAQNPAAGSLLDPDDRVVIRVAREPAPSPTQGTPNPSPTENSPSPNPSPTETAANTTTAPPSSPSPTATETP
jgi:eukaryotic-like serine/threonine-protein kinase